MNQVNKDDYLFSLAANGIIFRHKLLTKLIKRKKNWYRYVEYKLTEEGNKFMDEIINMKETILSTQKESTKKEIIQELKIE